MVKSSDINNTVRNQDIENVRTMNFIWEEKNDSQMRKIENNMIESYKPIHDSGNL